MQAIAACGSRGQEKRAARGCKRPKSREETPKEGGSNTTKSCYCTAIMCHRAAQNARGKLAVNPMCVAAIPPINGVRMTAVDFAAFVDELADVSGNAILPFFRTSLSVENKGGTAGFDPVTAADRAAEAAMRGLIRRSFPNHGIVGEEFASEATDAEYVWVLDPIDGTKSFICGMPAWGT